NAQGNPTNTILFEQANVPNVDLEWSTFIFPEPITVDDGFYIAISHPERLEIGIDAGTDPEYPFEHTVNWVSEDYGSNVFMLMEDLGLGDIPGNLMIRAEGYNTATGQKLQSAVAAPSRSLNTYTISRLEEGQEDTPELWTMLADDLTTTSYTDDDFSTVDPGWYKYAVNAVYSGEISSEAAFSNRIENQLSTQVTFNVTTNTPNNESLGAHILLSSNSGNYVYTQNVESEDGVVVFNGVFKNTYYVKITHEGFEDLVMSNVDFTTEATYEVDVELIEALAQPFNLEIHVNDDLSSVFRWNHTSPIVEDFESCIDFEIAPNGVVEWNYIDVDKKNTIGIENFTYLNENEPASFMTFTPSQTEPPIDVELNPGIAPHSGNKFLASFGVNSGSNDDYFISPKLNFGQEFTFSFFAKSFSNIPSLNKIMIGYSTTGFLPSDFIWITETAIAPAMDRWTRYDYDIPAEATYVTIRNVSDGGYILMVDDVEISVGASARELVNYQVYLNDNLMGETTEYTFNFSADDIIFNETNVAGVKAVYSSGESEMSTIEFLGVYTDTPEHQAQANMTVYPNPSNGSFTIELDGEYEVSILNSLGVTVYSKIISEQGRIVLEDLKPGMYIISAKSDQKAAFSRIIVQ
ncbi:MAG: T9SS type A sorting domain-containing protein, partial [Bacteroidales bacterium]|nr:T9SS type A sorting domain-containing protein [Bacteroidales bacterium]